MCVDLTIVFLIIPPSSGYNIVLFVFFKIHSIEVKFGKEDVFIHAMLLKKNHFNSLDSSVTINIKIIEVLELISLVNYL